MGVVYNQINALDIGNNANIDGLMWYLKEYFAMLEKFNALCDFLYGRYHS